MTGTQVNSGVTSAISSAISRDVYVNSNISLASNVNYNFGPFKNTGPIPPKVGKETTYTVTWKINNTFNNASNVVVSAVLPSYVKFLNNISPSNEPLTYNPVSGEVDWAVGNIKTDTGYNNISPRQVSFQVSIVPSVTQVGSVPILVGLSSLSGIDAFTGSTLKSTFDSVTTEVMTDPLYTNSEAMVTN